MCKNSDFTNEKLQQTFNTHLFKKEQEDYKKEKLPWKDVSFRDNAGCVDLISKPPNGVLPKLDEECVMPKGTDFSYLEKIFEINKVIGMKRKRDMEREGRRGMCDDFRYLEKRNVIGMKRERERDRKRFFF